MPKIKITKIVLKEFKKIEELDLELAPITALIGGNTSGKSSVLQGAQLCVSLLQAAFRRWN